MLLFMILKDKRTVPQGFSEAGTIQRCQQRGGTSSPDNRSGGLLRSTAGKTLARKKRPTDSIISFLE